MSFTISPQIDTVPSSTSSSPAMTRSVVVFPQPEGPSKLRISPRRTSSDTPFTARVSPNRLRTLPSFTSTASPIPRFPRLAWLRFQGAVDLLRQLGNSVGYCLDVVPDQLLRRFVGGHHRF